MKSSSPRKIRVLANKAGVFSIRPTAKRVGHRLRLSARAACLFSALAVCALAAGIVGSTSFASVAQKYLQGGLNGFASQSTHNSAPAQAHSGAQSAQGSGDVVGGLASSALGLPVLPFYQTLFSIPENIGTFASNCTTAKTEFVTGDVVCVKVTGSVSSFTFQQRKVYWVDPSGAVVQIDPISSSSPTVTRTVSTRGNWKAYLVGGDGGLRRIAPFTVSDPQQKAADLSVVKTPDRRVSSFAAGSSVTYRITVTNNGPDDADNVVLTEADPNDASFVSLLQDSGPTFTCTRGSTDTTCAIATLPANSVATFTAIYQINNGTDAGTEISNTATITSTTEELHTGDNSSTATEAVIPSPCMISCPADIHVTAPSGSGGVTVTYPSPTTQGDCGTVTSSVPSGSFFAVGTTPVTLAGKSGDACTFLVTVDSPGGLTITLNGDNPATAECRDGFDDPGATAFDAAHQPVPVTVQGSFDPATPGSYTITYTASVGTDSISTTRTVNVVDTSPPVITLNGANPLTVSCGQTFVDPGASAVDECSGQSVPVTVTGSVDSNTPGTYTITYSATDGINTPATATRTVVVDPSGNNSPPTIMLNGPDLITVECGSVFNDPGATATVGCAGGTVPVTVTGTVNTHAPGTYTLTYTATSGDQTAEVARTVIVEDTTAPVITINGANPLTVECHTSFTDPGATANDGCAGSFPATAAGSVDANTVGTYTITYTATDPSGNAATPVTRTVNVVDTTAPTISGVSGVTVTTGAGATSCGAFVSDAQLGTASATDGCAGPVGVTRAGVPAGNVFPVGSTTVTYTATDPSGNAATKTQTVTVVDNTPPTVTPPANVNANADPTSCSVTLNVGTATASDNCAGVTVGGARSDSQSLNAPYPKGTTTITWTATDASGNTASATQTVTVTDHTPPVITINGANPLVWECHTPFTDPGATAADACDGARSVSASNNLNVNTPGSYTVTYTATDASGNTASASRTVNVVDTTAPVITLNGQTPSMWPANHKYKTFLVTDFVTGVTDSCNTSLGVSSVTIAQVTSDETENGNGDGNTTNDIVIASNCKSLQLRAERDGGGNGRVYTITFRVRDASGNTGTATARVVVPHNPGETAVDSGAHYTVTGGCP